jgi:hypothetical protein
MLTDYLYSQSQIYNSAGNDLRSFWYYVDWASDFYFDSHIRMSRITEIYTVVTEMVFSTVSSDVSLDEEMDPKTRKHFELELLSELPFQSHGLHFPVPRLGTRYCKGKLRLSPSLFFNWWALSILTIRFFVEAHEHTVYEVATSIHQIADGLLNLP